MKERVISAIVAFIIFIPLIILGGTFFKLGVIVLSNLALKEMLDLKEKNKKLPFFIKLLSYLLVILFASSSKYNGTSYDINELLVLVTFILLLIPLVLYHDNDTYNIKDALYLIGITLFIGIIFNLFIFIRDYSINYFIFLFSITIITDTYAYFSGKLIGKHKLLPVISPKKTWEGSIFGSLIGTLVSFTIYFTLINNSCNVIRTVIIIFSLSVIGQIGDLVFSAIKRYYRKKDFSNIMPGHGGVLDRLDSIIFVLMAFVIIINYI